MKKLIIIIFLLPTIHYLNAQEKPELVSVKGEAQVEWHQDTESKQEAEKRAEKRAKVNALEKAFGTVVVQGNSTFIKNVDTGKKVETQTTFSMIGNTVVGGEIIKVDKINFQEHEEKYKRKGKKVSDIFITCKIEVTAKKLSETKIKFEAFALSGEMKNNITTNFYDGDDIFFYFKSPVSGYLSLYADITGTNITQRILPYSTVPKKYENGMPVNADEEYIFFSKTKMPDDYMKDNVIPDEIMASPDNEQETWKLFVVFSKDPLNKPSLKKNQILTEEDKKKNLSLPKELKSDDFQRWMIKNMQIRDDFQRKIIMLSVAKK